MQPIEANCYTGISVRVAILAIVAHSYIAIPIRGSFLKSLPIAALCNFFLHPYIGQELSNSSEILPMQPVAAHSCTAVLARLAIWAIVAQSYIDVLTSGKSSKVLSLQPIPAPSYIPILLRSWVIPENSSQNSPLQPTLTPQFWPAYQFWPF